MRCSKRALENNFEIPIVKGGCKGHWESKGDADLSRVPVLPQEQDLAGWNLLQWVSIYRHPNVGRHPTPGICY